MDAVAPCELLLGVLELALDLERDPARGHLETLALSLRFEFAILLQRPHPEPRESGNGNQGGGGQEHRHSTRAKAHHHAYSTKSCDQGIMIPSRSGHDCRA